MQLRNVDNVRGNAKKKKEQEGTTGFPSSSKAKAKGDTQPRAKKEDVPDMAPAPAPGMLEKFFFSTDGGATDAAAEDGGLGKDEGTLLKQDVVSVGSGAASSQTAARRRAEDDVIDLCSSSESEGEGRETS